MTAAEKNRVIAEYMGFVTENRNTKYPNTSIEISAIDERIRDLIDDSDFATWKGITTKFDTSWDWLMPVWQKLRGELVREKYNRALDKDRSTTAMFTIEAIERAIAEDSDITTAHQLIYEAIKLIKK